MARIAITGVNGFVGRHLSVDLSVAGHTVVGIGREAEAVRSDLLDEYVQADLVEQWPRIPRVDAIVHLAGLAAVGPSFDEPARYLNDNSAMVINMFESLVADGAATRALVVSSGAIYDSHAPQPLDEDAPVEHTSPYVVSKVLVENLTSYYRGRGADAVVVRPFNHIGPWQREGFLVPDLVDKVRNARASGEPPVFGNLTTRRDYTDVRDVVRAYRLLLEADALEHPVYNVCSGTSLEGAEILGIVQDLLGGAGDAEPATATLRPQDPSSITGSHERITRAVGWEPRIPPAVSIGDYIAALDDPAEQR